VNCCAAVPVLHLVL